MAKKNTPSQNEMEKAADKLPIAIDANILYNEFIGLTNIERAGDEDYVLRELLRGASKSEIIRNLTAKHKDKEFLKFNYPDLERFIARNQAIVRAMGKEVSLSAERHLQAREQCEEMLAGLAMYTQGLIKDFRAENDNTNTVGAIRALNTTLESYMRVKGFVGPKNEAAQVTNVVQIVSEGRSSLRDKVNRANFVDAELSKEPNDSTKD